MCCQNPPIARPFFAASTNRRSVTRACTVFFGPVPVVKIIDSASVFVPDLPSVATQGETVEEALDMARDAIEGYLEIMRDEGWPVPTVRRERVAVEAA